MTQIINEDSVITESLDKYLDEIGVSRIGLDYHVISVIGCQSSGKSTLLNNLFKTNFVTMNDMKGRQQTTKGIHASFNDKKILIFDIEGSDSRERGDADALFERKSALFALALSEVVMVNMWEYDIGRYNAGNIPLLKTVFEVNLQLFSSNEGKCNLLFVIRDSSQSIDVIRKQVQKDLEMIWKGLTIPPHLAGKTFEDFFIFDIFTLSHLRLKKAEFMTEVNQLSQRFLDSSCEKYIFSREMGKLIPGDSLSQYIRNVWDSIHNNKELNLPSQRRTLSNFRCEEFSSNAFSEFQKELNTQIIPQVVDKSFDKFGSISTDIVSKAIDLYNSESSRYIADIVSEKLEFLKNRMGASLFPVFDKNCMLKRGEILSSFTHFIETDMNTVLEETDGWEFKANETLNSCVNELSDFIEKSRPLQYKWTFLVTDFESSLRDLLGKKLQDLINNTEDRIINKHKNSYKEMVNEILERSDERMWEDIREKMNTEITRIYSDIEEVLQKNTINSHPSSQAEKLIQKATTSCVLVASEFVPQKMIDKFEMMFLLDEKGEKRIWQQHDDINQYFEEARESGLSILKRFSNCCLRSPGETMQTNDILTMVIISPVRSQGIESKYNESIEKYYIDAVHIRESKRINAIPVWMWLLFLLVGYDKIVSAIRHPYISLTIVFTLTLLYYLNSLHLFDNIKTKAKALSIKGLQSMAHFLQKSNTTIPLPPSLPQRSEDQDFRTEIDNNLDPLPKVSTISSELSNESVPNKKPAKMSKSHLNTLQPNKNAVISAVKRSPRKTKQPQ